MNLPEDQPCEPEFDRHASRYQALATDPARAWFGRAAYFHRRKLEVLERLLHTVGRNSAEMDWVDFGCGQGELLRQGRGRFASARGCDVSAKMLASCGDLDVRVQPDAAVAPFPDACADLVTAVCVMHHVPGEARAALCRDLARLVRPGGWLAVMEHNPRNPLTQFIVRRSEVDRGVNLLEASEASILAAGAGLHALDPVYFLLLPQFLGFAAEAVEVRLARWPVGGQYVLLAQKPTA